ncbi:MAG: hypothetical protein LAO20_06270 [Acidobacteriia bacterium]|nr:hypothetical protein [Terriglobia bacterium]
MKTHIAYDTRSGQIISVHRGPADAAHAQQRAHERSKIAREHLAAIEVQSDAMQPGKLYKIDPQRKALVEVAAGEKGSGFGGGTGRKY